MQILSICQYCGIESEILDIPEESFDIVSFREFLACAYCDSTEKVIQEV